MNPLNNLLSSMENIDEKKLFLLSFSMKKKEKKRKDSE